jgi:hypothetical protein
MLATRSRCHAISEFRVMGEVVSDEELKHRDGQQRADVQSREAILDALRDQLKRARPG